MNYKYAGYLAAFTSAAAFLPTAYNMHKTKQTQGFSIKTAVLLFISQLFWLIDGFAHSDVGLVISSFIHLPVYLYLFYMKMTY